jgi:excisionase family DNA binding protein
MTSEPNVPLSRQLFSVRAAAVYLGVSPSTVRCRIAAGAVRAHRWGRTWMLWRDDLDWYCMCLTSTGGVGSADDAAEKTGAPSRTRHSADAGVRRRPRSSTVRQQHGCT